MILLDHHEQTDNELCAFFSKSQNTFLLTTSHGLSTTSFEMSICGPPLNEFASLHSLQNSFFRLNTYAGGDDPGDPGSWEVRCKHNMPSQHWATTRSFVERSRVPLTLMCGNRFEKHTFEIDSRETCDRAQPLKSQKVSLRGSTLV